MATTTHHLQPAWFYLAILPLLVFPWLFVPSVWQGFAGLVRAPAEPVTRFALAWAVPALLAFSAFAGKQAQYLLPQTAAFALLVGTALAARDRAGTAPPIADRLVVAGVLFLLAVAFVGLTGQPRFANLIQSGERPGHRADDRGDRRHRGGAGAAARAQPRRLGGEDRHGSKSLQAR